MDPNQLATDADGGALPAMEDVRAWEEITSGRYMPRRIRGSCRGRVLG
jgi:hypothetical protein